MSAADDLKAALTAIADAGSDAWNASEALVSEAQSQRAALEAQIADLTTKMNQQEDRVEELEAELARLQAIIDGDDDPPPPPPASVAWGMSSPAAEWPARIAEVGPGVTARRIFLDLDTAPTVTLAKQALDAGMLPVISLATTDWSGAFTGKYDARLAAWRSALVGLNRSVRVTVKHEPSGDGDEVLWGRMLARCLPLLSGPGVEVGPIDNGFKWSPTKGVNKGWTDASLATVYTPALLAVCDFLACDTYHGGPADGSGENAAPKIRGFSAWATRIGWTGDLGLGEWNGVRPADIAAAADAVKADPRYAFACVFNSNRNNREGIQWQLTGDRLAAFRAVLAG